MIVLALFVASIVCFFFDGYQAGVVVMALAVYIAARTPGGDGSEDEDI